MAEQAAKLRVKINSRGLVRLGRVEGDVSGLAGKDPIVVRIENIATEAHRAAGSGQGD